MHTVKLYQVDAFSRTVFKGNPAAVIIRDEFLPDAVMQNIAMENNLSETAFVVPRTDSPGQYDLRWFTPVSEVDFCGHATLASAHVLLREMKKNAPLIFHTRVGPLEVTESGERLSLKAPKPELTPLAVTDDILRAFPVTITEAFHSEKSLFLVFEDDADVRAAVPDLNKIIQLAELGVVITAKGKQPEDSEQSSGEGLQTEYYDCVSRFFVPAEGIDEDPVTGSIHAALGAYWSGVLGKSRLSAYQASKRGGQLDIEIEEDWVHIAGHTVTFMTGTITLPKSTLDLES